MPVFTYTNGTEEKDVFFTSSSNVPKVFTENGEEWTKIIACPTLVGMNWAKISRENTRRNSDAGKRGHSYWKNKMGVKNG